MNIEKFREVMKERDKLALDAPNEWEYGLEKCWEQEIEILTEDIDSTIECFKT